MLDVKPKAAPVKGKRASLRRIDRLPYICVVLPERGSEARLFVSTAWIRRRQTFPASAWVEKVVRDGVLIASPKDGPLTAGPALEPYDGLADSIFGQFAGKHPKVWAAPISSANAYDWHIGGIS